MNINFNIPDDVGNNFVSASRWQIDRPDLNDSKVCNKYLKKCISALVNNYSRSLVVGSDEATANTLEQQLNALKVQFVEAKRTYEEKLDQFQTGFNPLDLGD